MGTRSIISKKIPMTGYKAVYCHWDGYPEEPGVGWRLKKYYTSNRKINELLDLGDISSLGKNIGEKHDFDKDFDKAIKKGWTTAYHRDRGDLRSQTKPKMFKLKKDLKMYAESGWTEYLYIYENGKWNVIEV